MTHNYWHRPLRAQCPECKKFVTLGLYGEVYPWHPIPNGRSPCPGEGMKVQNGQQTEERGDGR